MFCSKCGSPNDDTGRFCQKCGSPLAVPAPAAPAPQYAAPAQYATPAPPHDPRMRTTSPPPQAVEGKSFAVGKTPWVAVLLSVLIPGLGQFYNGDMKKGGIMIVAYIVSWALTAVVIGGLGVFGVWLWSVIDAYRVAKGTAPLG